MCCGGRCPGKERPRDSFFGAPTRRRPFSQRVRADLIFRERLSGEDAFDAVKGSMPDTRLRLFQQETRRRHTDLGSLIRDVVCEALTERAEASARSTAAREWESERSDADLAMG